MTTGGRAVVVGGGLAGITAALDLADAGASVTLVESRPRLGGLTTSFTRGDLQVDTGQHVFLRCCTAYRGLLDRLGVTGRTVLQDRLDVPVIVSRGRRVRTARLRRGRDLRPPLHLGTALLRYSALPLADRLRAAPAAWALGRLDPATADARTFGSWLTEHGQSPAAVEALWGLLTVATLNADPADASLALAAKVVRTGLLETPDGADIGWSAVPLAQLHGDAAAAALAVVGGRVLLGARVAAIDPSGHGWDVAISPARGRAHTLSAEQVVLATPPDIAAALAPPQAGLDNAALGRLGVSPIVNIHLVYDRPVMREAFAAVVGSPVQWIFDRSAASGLPAGTYLALSQSAAAPWVDVPSATLLAQFTAEIERLLPATRGARLVDGFVTRERAATFRQVPGQAALRPPAGTAAPGLAVAGAWTDTGWPATMESAVRSGHAAAAHLLRSPLPAEVAA